MSASLDDLDRALGVAYAEIDTLRAKLAERDALLREAAIDIRGWRQLAPRHKPSLDLLKRMDAALSASVEPKPFTTPDCPDCACVQDGQCLCTPSKPSAEPSAPVERDERADFEKEYLRRYPFCANDLRKNSVGEFMDYHIYLIWLGWQARAALECKPNEQSMQALTDDRDSLRIEYARLRKSLLRIQERCEAFVGDERDMPGHSIEAIAQIAAKALERKL